MLFVSVWRVARTATVGTANRGRAQGRAGPALRVLIGFLVIALTGCAARPFNVKPRPSLSQPDYRASGQIEGIGIQAEAITDEDYLYEIFDANLLQAGVYPVRIKVTNSRADAVELKRAKFEIKSPAGKRYREVEARRAYKRLIKYYELTLYSLDGYKRSLSDFKSHTLDIAGPLGPGDSRDGILFFLLPAEVAEQGGLIFGAERLSNRANADLELKLK